MVEKQSSLSDWTPAQISAGRRWVNTWAKAGPALDQIRRAELRELDSRQAIALLLGLPTSTASLRSTSGLVDQQRWFMRAAKREKRT